MLKKIISLISALAIALTFCVIPSDAAETFQSAKEYTDSITVGWNLGNTLDTTGDWIKLYTKNKSADYEKAWGNPITTKEMITVVKKAGFNAVRVPVTWADHMDSSGNVDKEWMERVQEVVDYVISQDMYCILNVHHDGGSDGWIVADPDMVKKNGAKFSKLWKQIAVRFKNYGNKLSFESFNEVLDKNDNWNSSGKDAYRAINDLNQLFVDAVRATGGNNSKRNLIIQSYAASSDTGCLNNLSVPSDTAENHIIAEVHSYDPVSFCWKEASWTTLTDVWGSASDKAEIDKLISKIADYSKKSGIPVILGEFASEDKNNDSERAQHASYVVSKAAENGIKCFWWDTGNMALIDRVNLKVLHPKVVNAMMKAVGTSSKTTANAADTTSEIKLSGKKTSSSVKLTWTKADGAYGYKVYEYNAETGKYVKKAYIKGTSKSFSGLSAGKHKYIVIAYTKDGKKVSTSNAVTVTIK